MNRKGLGTGKECEQGECEQGRSGDREGMGTGTECKQRRSVNRDGL